MKKLLAKLQMLIESDIQCESEPYRKLLKQIEYEAENLQDENLNLKEALKEAERDLKEEQEQREYEVRDLESLLRAAEDENFLINSHRFGCLDTIEYRLKNDNLLIRQKLNEMFSSLS